MLTTTTMMVMTESVVVVLSGCCCCFSDRLISSRVLWIRSLYFIANTSSAPPTPPTLPASPSIRQGSVQPSMASLPPLPSQRLWMQKCRGGVGRPGEGWGRGRQIRQKQTSDNFALFSYFISTFRSAEDYGNFCGDLRRPRSPPDPEIRRRRRMCGREHAGRIQDSDR